MCLDILKSINNDTSDAMFLHFTKLSILARKHVYMEGSMQWQFKLYWVTLKIESSFCFVLMVMNKGNILKERYKTSHMRNVQLKTKLSRFFQRKLNPSTFSEVTDSIFGRSIRKQPPTLKSEKHSCTNRFSD